MRARIYRWKERSFSGNRPVALSLPAEGTSMCRGAEVGGWVTREDSHGHHPDLTRPRPAGPQQAVENQTVFVAPAKQNPRAWALQALMGSSFHWFSPVSSQLSACTRGHFCTFFFFMSDFHLRSKQVYPVVVWPSAFTPRSANVRIRILILVGMVDLINKQWNCAKTHKGEGSGGEVQ